MKRVALTTAATLATLTAVLIMWQLSEIVILFGVSLAVASIVRAPTAALVRRGWRPSLAILAVYVVGIGLPLLLFVALAWRMIPEADLLLQEFITLYARFYSRLRSGSEMTQALSERLRDPNTLNTLFGDGDGVGAINAFLQTTQSVGAVAGQMLIAVAVSIYWTADQVRFERVWLSLLSPQRRGVARTQCARSKRASAPICAASWRRVSPPARSWRWATGCWACPTRPCWRLWPRWRG